MHLQMSEVWVEFIATVVQLSNVVIQIVLIIDFSSGVSKHSSVKL